MIFDTRQHAPSAKVFPALQDRRVAARQFRWPEKIPTFHAGYLDAVAVFFAEMQEGPVCFCGDYLAGPGTGATLCTGWHGADRILALMRVFRSTP